MLSSYIRFSIIFLSTILLSSCNDDAIVVELIIENHRFLPKVLNLKPDQRYKVKIINKDNVIEEFESFDLKREKIIPSKSSANIYIGPLKPGTYNFFGEFHAETAKGKIIINKSEEKH